MMFHSVTSEDNDTNSSTSSSAGVSTEHSSSAGCEQRKEFSNVSLQASDSNDSDNEISCDKIPTQQPLLGAVSRGQRIFPSVSINADPSVECISVPVCPRSRIWPVFGSLGRESSLQHHSRNPCHIDCTHQHGVVQDYNGYLETAPLIPGRYEHAQRSQIVASNVSQVTPSRGSVCSTAGVQRPAASARNFSESGDDVTTSNDSHCHSSIKKGGFDKKARTRLILASVLCLMFMTGEMVGGLLAHSLAIISDAAHLLTDFASFMISLMALYLAHRPATKKLSFGWYRIEILGAFVSILMLWVLTGILVYSAALRIMDDTYEIDAMVMLITAATGVAFNVVLGATLHQHAHSHGGHGHSHGGHDSSHRGHGKSHKKHKTDNSMTRNQSQTLSSSGAHNYGSFRDVEVGGLPEPHPHSDFDHTDDDDNHSHSHTKEPSNINVKAAFIHVIGDLFQSVGVLAAAFIIYFKPEWKIADPICTFLFSLFVLITTITIMRDILVVLMEGTPRGINFSEVRNTFFEVEGVLDIHNLRVWSLTMDKIALSVHLAVDKQSDPHKVLKSASEAIKQKFNISETTMQIEEYVMEMIDCQDCQGPKL